MFNIPLEITYLTAALSVIVASLFFAKSKQTTPKRFALSAHAAIPVALALVMPLVAQTDSESVVAANTILTLALYAAAAVSFFYCLARFDGPKFLHVLHVVPIFFAFHTAPLVLLEVVCAAGGCH